MNRLAKLYDSAEVSLSHDITEASDTKYSLPFAACDDRAVS